MYKITSVFGAMDSIRGGRVHKGVDFSMPTGEPLRAVKEGIVKIVDFGGFGAGKTVFIETAEGQTFIYGHLSKFNVRSGDFVALGQKIGEAGNTGLSTGSHLHLEVRESGAAVDPAPYIEFVQNMNNPQYIAKLQAATEIASSKAFDFGHAMSQFSEGLTSIDFGQFKANFVHIFSLLG